MKSRAVEWSNGSAGSMRYFILCGCQDMCFIEAKGEIERSLDISMEERESDYQGGVYYAHKYESGEAVVLKVNIDLFDNEPAEREFAEFPVLLYLSYVRDPRPFMGALSSKFRLLRQKQL